MPEHEQRDRDQEGQPLPGAVAPEQSPVDRLVEQERAQDEGAVEAERQPGDVERDQHRRSERPADERAEREAREQIRPRGADVLAAEQRRLVPRDGVGGHGRSLPLRIGQNGRRDGCEPDPRPPGGTRGGPRDRALPRCLPRSPHRPLHRRPLQPTSSSSRRSASECSAARSPIATSSSSTRRAPCRPSCCLRSGRRRLRLALQVPPDRLRRRRGRPRRADAGAAGRDPETALPRHRVRRPSPRWRSDRRC